MKSKAYRISLESIRKVRKIFFNFEMFGNVRKCSYGAGSDKTLDILD